MNAPRGNGSLSLSSASLGKITMALNRALSEHARVTGRSAGAIMLGLGLYQRVQRLREGTEYLGVELLPLPESFNQEEIIVC